MGHLAVSPPRRRRPIAAAVIFYLLACLYLQIVFQICFVAVEMFGETPGEGDTHCQYNVLDNNPPLNKRYTSLKKRGLHDYCKTFTCTILLTV